MDSLRSQARTRQSCSKCIRRIGSRTRPGGGRRIHRLAQSADRPRPANANGTSQALNRLKAGNGSSLNEATMKWTMKIAIAAAMTAALAASADAEPVKIRAGWVLAPASLLPVLFAKQGLARHQGKSYLLEPVYFSASPAQITAMSVGELQIAALGFSSFPFAVQNAGLADLRIIADEIQDGGKDN